MAKKQTEWTRHYNEKAYDRLAITIPKGQKQVVAAFAERNGESINSLVNKLLMERMGVSDGEWRQPVNNGQEVADD